MTQAAQNHGIGQPVRRREDQRLLTGKGRFSDDFNLPGQRYAMMLRSPHEFITALHAAVVNAVASPKVTQQFDTAGTQLVAGSSEAFAVHIRAEIAKRQNVPRGLAPSSK